VVGNANVPQDLSQIEKEIAKEEKRRGEWMKNEKQDLASRLAKL